MPQASQQAQQQPFLVSVDEAIAQLEDDLAKLRSVREILNGRPRPRVGVVAPPKLNIDQAKFAGATARAAAPSPTTPPSVTVPPPREKRKRGRAPLMLTYGDRTLSINQWSEEKRIGVDTIRYRYKAGWPVEKILGGALHSRGSNPADPDDAPDSPADPANIDVEARAAGIAPIPGLQQKLDALEGKPVVLPAAMAFVFDPNAPAETCIPSLKAETARRQKVQGGRQRTVEFITTASRGHVHVAVLDHFGDGQTKVDSTGHVHRFCRWKMIEAHKHEHGLAMTEPKKD